MNTKAIVTIHGGNFVVGNTYWDRIQTQQLEKLGYRIYPLKLNSHSLSLCIKELREKVRIIRKQHNTVYGFGKYSGGYLVKYLFEEGLFEKTIYINPIFNPYTYLYNHPEQREKSELFFKNSSIPCEPLIHWKKDREVLLLSESSEFATLSKLTETRKMYFTETQLKCASYTKDTIKDNMDQVLSKDTIQIIQEFLDT